MEPLYPHWYDANNSCDYHYEIKSHSIKNYLALKNNVQTLKNAGYVSFGYDKNDGSNVTSNPLSNHSKPKINVVLEGLAGGRKSSIKSMLRYKSMLYKGYYQYHAEV